MIDSIDFSDEFNQAWEGKPDSRLCYQISDAIYRQITPLPLVGWWQILGLYYYLRGTEVRHQLLRNLLWNQPIDYGLYPEERARRWYMVNINKVISILIRKGKVKPFAWMPATRTARPIRTLSEFMLVHRNSFILPVNGHRPRKKERTIPHDMDVASVLVTLNLFFGAELYPRKVWRWQNELFRWNRGTYPDGAIEISNEIFGIEVERTVNIPRLIMKLHAYPARGSALVFLDLAKDKSVEQAIERLKGYFYYATKLGWVREKDSLVFTDHRGFMRCLTKDGFTKEKIVKLTEDGESSRAVNE